MLAASHFGVTLKQRNRWTVNRHEGIARVHGKRRDAHVVVIRRGLVFDTDHTVWTPDDYLAGQAGAKFGALLEVQE